MTQVSLSRGGATTHAQTKLDGWLSPCVTRVWSLVSRQCTLVLEGHTKNVWSVAVTPDGQSIVSGSADKTVRCACCCRVCVGSAALALPLVCEQRYLG